MGKSDVRWEWNLTSIKVAHLFASVLWQLMRRIYGKSATVLCYTCVWSGPVYPFVSVIKVPFCVCSWWWWWWREIGFTPDRTPSSGSHRVLFERYKIRFEVPRVHSPLCHCLPCKFTSANIHSSLFLRNITFLSINAFHTLCCDYALSHGYPHTHTHTATPGRKVTGRLVRPNIEVVNGRDCAFYSS